MRKRKKHHILTPILVILALVLLIWGHYGSLANFSRQIYAILPANVQTLLSRTGTSLTEKLFVDKNTKDTVQSLSSLGQLVLEKNAKRNQVMQTDYDLTNYLNGKTKTTVKAASGSSGEATLALSGNTLTVTSVNGSSQSAAMAEIHTASEADNGTITVGEGHNATLLSDSGILMNQYLVYISGASKLITVPPIIQTSQGYQFMDFSNANQGLPTDPDAKRAESQDYFQKVGDQILTAAGASDESAADKVRAVHDYICQNFSYDEDLAASPTQENFIDDDVVSWQNQRGICENYARWTADILNAMGISCLKVNGIGVNSSQGNTIHRVNHSWNLVQIDGVWYPMDVTWDCGNRYSGGTVTSGEMRDTYFLSAENMNQDHLFIAEANE